MRTQRLLPAVSALVFFCASCLVIQAASVSVTGLRCEYGTDPLGIDVPAPRLSWKLESSQRAQGQTAYQVLAASNPDLLAPGKADLWDSKKVRSSESLHIRYSGKPLSSSQRVFWKVRVWDANERATDWSPAAQWTMGVLKDQDWQAQWISFTTNIESRVSYIGYHASTSDEQEVTKWVQVDLQEPAKFDSIVLYPMDHGGKKGFGFPLRFKIEISQTPDFAQSITIADHTAQDYPSPGADPVPFPVPAGDARYVRVTAAKLWLRDTRFVFALCELEVLRAGQNLALKKPVTAMDSVQEFGWGKTGLTDGICGERNTVKDPQTLALRREFRVKPKLSRAILNVCGLGTYEATINGAKVGDALFPPGWTKYDKTCLYDTYDVTAIVREGGNAIGLLLGNGMYNVQGGRYKKFLGSFGPLQAIAQLRLEYEDGTVQVVGTGKDWKFSPGPITFSCVYGGEDYDARLEPKGWNQPGFNDNEWSPALTTAGPGGKLRGFSCSSPPVRVFEILKPEKVKELKPGVKIYDLGQNTSMMPRIRVKGPAGSAVRIIPAELVSEDGSVDRQSCGRGTAYWQYTLAGTSSEVWFPKFYYHGARYLQVECIAPKNDKANRPEVQLLEGVVVHGDSEPRADFSSSNELFNRIRKLVRWAQRSNLTTVLTDCPHREKLGWLEQYHLNGPSIRYEFDLANLFTKSMNDMADSQLQNGLVPDIAPEYVVFNGGFRDSPEWGSACAIVPWQQYLFEGDIELLRRYFGVMEAYVAYLGSTASNNIVSHGLGDWYDIGPNPPGYAQLTPIPLTATAFYYYDVRILSTAARLLGDETKEKQYAKLAEEIKQAFNREFYKPEQGTYATGSQAGNAIALVMDLAPAQGRAAVLDAIVRDIRARGNALTAGDVGYRYLLRALSEGGRSDVIYDMNNQSEKPGYGYQLAKGATSLTEAWDARPQSSHNHFMLGQIMEWFYHDLVGIQPSYQAPGFKKIVIKPSLPGDMTWAQGSYNSPYGPIHSRWEKQEDRVTLKITIPANTTAEVHVPAKDTSRVTESGKPARKAKGVRWLRNENGCAVFETGSGSYVFES